VALWVANYFPEVTAMAPVRTAYVHAWGPDEAARIAGEHMRDDEKRVDVVRAVLRPGIRLPRGALLNPGPLEPD
jgi:hypothetical protein